MMSYDAKALLGAQHMRAVQAQRPDGEDVAVVGVGDGAISVEHAGDALLRPVAAGQLRTEQIIQGSGGSRTHRNLCCCTCWLVMTFVDR